MAKQYVDFEEVELGNIADKVITNTICKDNMATVCEIQKRDGQKVLVEKGSVTFTGKANYSTATCALKDAGFKVGVNDYVDVEKGVEYLLEWDLVDILPLARISIKED